MKVLVNELMSAPVVTATIDSTAGQVRELMERKSVSAIPIVELKPENIRVRGIVSLFDLAGITDDDTPVEEVMSTFVKVIEPETSAIQAANIMMEQDIHHLIVMKGGRIVGMVSSMDFVRLVSDKKMHSFASVIFV